MKGQITWNKRNSYSVVERSEKSKNTNLFVINAKVFLLRILQKRVLVVHECCDEIVNAYLILRRKGGS